MNKEDEELDELEEPLPSYEMYEIQCLHYSHIIISNVSPEYGEEIIAYKSRATNIWECTDTILEFKPETLEEGYLIPLSSIENFEQDRLVELIGSDKLFIGML